MANANEYLTVQDHLWINLQVTKSAPKWDFAKLEEASNFQYAYGTVTDLFARAARYAVGFAKNQPFGAGNEATAAVGLLTFLGVNGYELTSAPTHLVEWFVNLAGASDPAEQLRSMTKPADGHGHPTVESVAKHLLSVHGAALRQTDLSPAS